MPVVTVIKSFSVGTSSSHHAPVGSLIDFNFWVSSQPRAKKEFPFMQCISNGCNLNSNRSCKPRSNIISLIV